MYDAIRRGGAGTLYLLDLRQAPAGPVADWFAGKGSATPLFLWGVEGEDLRA